MGVVLNDELRDTEREKVKKESEGWGKMRGNLKELEREEIG